MKAMLNRLPNKVLLFVLSVTTLLLTACSMPKELDENEDIARQVANTPGMIQNHVLYISGPDGDFKLHYASSDPSKMSRHTVVFVHGTPGDRSSFARYFQNVTLKDRFRLISIDRPGWGISTYAGHYPTELQKQSSQIGLMLKNIWEQNGQQKIILVGHSLGGSLVPILAADYPQYVRGVVIVAGDLSPTLAEGRWYNTLLDWTPDFLIPDKWNNSNKEVLALSQSLANAQTTLSGLKVPITLLQGTEDTLVDPENATFASQLFQHSEIKIDRIQDAGHLLHLQYPNRVIDAIEDVNSRSLP